MKKRHTKPTTVNEKDQMPNIIANLDDLNGVSTIDIPYIQLNDKTRVYMASAYDPENRKILSCKISDSMTSRLATSVIVTALRQYTSELFENTLAGVGIRHSYDNTRIESLH
jgi:putative transposase